MLQGGPLNKIQIDLSNRDIPGIEFITLPWYHRINKTKIRLNPRIQQAYLSEGVKVVIQNGSLQIQ